ncbi:hypothetical protein [Trichlorobacter lovleyi]|uniref:hypothetical protein n=1 Tax=Trichlorobacter lovleyi TaxID=313985 RepID=UPI00247FC58B|nr:hypothetical protein [Trichlorobacter lovleyi]
MQLPDTHISGGYIRLFRQLLDSDLFSKPPHYLKLWIWMLLKARWQDGQGLKRGQLLTSIKEMCDVGAYKSGNRLTGKLSVDQVRAAYGWMRQTGAIKVADTTRGLLISIIKYDTYQASDSCGPQQNPDPTRDTTPDTTPEPTPEQPKMLVIVRESQQMSTPDPTPDTTPEPARTPHHLEKGKKESLVASKKAKRPPSGDHQTFVTWWCMAYQTTQSKPYLFAAKDAKAAKTLLGLHPIKHLILIASHFLTVEDAFLANRRDLPMLQSQINRMPPPGEIMAGNAARFRSAGLLPPDGVLLEDWKFWEIKETTTNASA